jgi:hypothetical protein
LVEDDGIGLPKTLADAFRGADFNVLEIQVARGKSFDDGFFGGESMLRK